MWEKDRRIKVYISSPYGRRAGLSDDEIEKNVRYAVEVGRELLLLGCIPLIPHLYHYVHKDWNKTLEEPEWLKICLELIEDCDIFLSLGESYGCQCERLRALHLGKRVCYSVKEV